MNSRHLIDRFAAARERGEAMVLVTVYETLGSTYSKAGARMLILAEGGSQGLVSGGCLEGDLAERARRVLATGEATTVTYDLRDEADELFGLGVGCNGLISVLLQALTPANGFEPMATIADVLLGERIGGLATVIEAAGDRSEANAAAAGASLVVAGEAVTAFGVGADAVAVLTQACHDAIASGSASLQKSAAGARVLFAPLVPVPRVLILGAGLDAVPLVNLIAELGWRVTIADHRPGYLQRDGFERAGDRRVVAPTKLGQEIDLKRYDGIVVMSHHLATDREYLRQLAEAGNAYIGLLGPPARRERLISELGSDAGSLATRLRGPVGIDIGADSAESIALSIAAELQRVLATGA